MFLYGLVIPGVGDSRKIGPVITVSWAGKRYLHFRSRRGSGALLQDGGSMQNRVPHVDADKVIRFFLYSKIIYALSEFSHRYWQHWLCLFMYIDLVNDYKPPFSDRGADTSVNKPFCGCTIKLISHLPCIIIPRSWFKNHLSCIILTFTRFKRSVIKVSVSCSLFFFHSQRFGFQVQAEPFDSEFCLEKAEQRVEINRRWSRLIIFENHAYCTNHTSNVIVPRKKSRN